MRNRNGFTLVEILIVVVILGILAAIVIPQFSSASEDAKLSTLMSDLQTIRSQIQLYKLQHNNTLPTGATFATQMTTYTLEDGSAAPIQGPGTGIYGPYLQQMPKNPFDEVNTVTAGTGTPGSGSGWYFNTTTGAFNANDSTEHAAL